MAPPLPPKLDPRLWCPGWPEPTLEPRRCVGLPGSTIAEPPSPTEVSAPESIWPIELAPPPLAPPPFDPPPTPPTPSRAPAMIAASPLLLSDESDRASKSDGAAAAASSLSASLYAAAAAPRSMASLAARSSSSSHRTSTSLTNAPSSSYAPCTRAKKARCDSTFLASRRLNTTRLTASARWSLPMRSNRAVSNSCLVDASSSSAARRCSSLASLVSARNLARARS